VGRPGALALDTPRIEVTLQANDGVPVSTEVGVIRIGVRSTSAAFARIMLT
jgi:hypothetical protein